MSKFDSINSRNILIGVSVIVIFLLSLSINYLRNPYTINRNSNAEKAKSNAQKISNAKAKSNANAAKAKSNANAAKAKSNANINNKDSEVLQRVDTLFSNVFKLITTMNSTKTKQTVIASINGTFEELRRDRKAIAELNKICKTNNLGVYNLDYLADASANSGIGNPTAISNISNIVSANISDLILYISYNYFCTGNKFNIEKLQHSIIQMIDYYYDIDYTALSKEQKIIMHKPILKFLEFSSN
jgi:hypothetical protein